MRTKEQSHLYYTQNKEYVLARQWKYRLGKLYGMTPGEFTDRLKAQNNKCAICGSSDPQTKHCGTFVIDHNHTTGKVRGLLCSACNRALGLLKDNPEFLERAAEYLREM